MSDNGYGDQGLSASARKYAERVQRATERLWTLDHLHAKLLERDYDLLWVRISFRPGRDTEILLVLKALGPDGAPMIAFVGSSSVVLALDKLRASVENDKLTWKVDDYEAARGGIPSDSGRS